MTLKLRPMSFSHKSCYLSHLTRYHHTPGLMIWKAWSKIILRRYDNLTMTSMSRSTFNWKFKNYIFAFVLTVIFAVSLSLLLLLLLLVLSRFGPRNIMVTLNRPIRLFHWRDVISSASWQHITIGWACLRVRKWRAESIVASMLLATKS